MKKTTLVLSATGLLLASLVPFGFGQAASSDAAAAKPKVVITDDNLSEQIPAKTASDDAMGSTQASPAVAAPSAMSLEEITALEKAIADKKAALADIQEHKSAMEAKLVQESDDEKKSGEQDYINACTKTINWYAEQLAGMEKKLADAKASADPQTTDDNHADQTASGIDETSTGAPASK
jgi:hypothetical protein